MNIEEAVNRIKKRIESGGWKTNDKDIDAFNEVATYINRKEIELFNIHELFAKLYIRSYSEFMEKGVPVKELNKLLEQPLSIYIQRFTDKVNNDEVEMLFDELNLSKNHPATIPQELKDKETDILLEALKDNENKNKLFREVWNYETVKEILVTHINHFLNIYYYDKPNFKKT